MAARRFVSPEPGEDFAALAARVVPDAADAAQAAEQLLSWNLHLATRIVPGRAPGLLPSDIVFTEPPPLT